MNLVHILLLCAVSFLIGLVKNRVVSKHLILTISVILLFALQPKLPIRYLGFWFPFGTLIITILSWVITSSKENINLKKSLPEFVIIIFMVLLIGIKKNWEPLIAFFPSQPPQLFQLLISIFAFGVLFFILVKTRTSITSFWMGIILLIFLIIKTPILSYQSSILFRTLNDQSPELANSLDIRWLGFSYIAFRLIHTIRDRQTGRLPAVSLVDYINYVIYFPSLVAGPIDRLENFFKKIESPLSDKWEILGEGGRRVVTGLFKKYVIADSVALFALNSTNALQIRSTGWMWISVYAFALQIFFDFSGYTDIAIGMSRFMGILLPENFTSPYFKTNITLFWNNWHITLTQWFRTYFFNPLTRGLRSRYKKLSVTFVILFTQLCTMILIGLWHGVSINFILWGLWHGIGLFIHNRWTSTINLIVERWASSPIKKQLLNVFGIIATFNFVAIGWVFFVLPSPYLSLHVLLKLFGGI